MVTNFVMRERFYRSMPNPCELKKFRVRVEETDMLVMAEKDLGKQAKQLVMKERSTLKSYINAHPEFYTSFSPVPCKSEEKIIKLMSDSAHMTCTGPMASVAGAIAEMTGQRLLNFSGQVMVENGGDIYVMMNRDFTAGIYAGNSPLSFRIGIKLKAGNLPAGIATSSATVGHSFSYGRADAVTVVSRSAALSDGAATYFCNLTGRQLEKKHVEREISKFPFIDGMVIINGKEVFAWGKIELVSF